MRRLSRPRHTSFWEMWPSLLLFESSRQEVGHKMLISMRGKPDRAKIAAPMGGSRSSSILPRKQTDYRATFRKPGLSLPIALEPSLASVGLGLATSRELLRNNVRLCRPFAPKSSRSHIRG